MQTKYPIEFLEPRLLLSGLPPHAVNQSLSTLEDTLLRLTPGATFIAVQGRGYVFSGNQTWTTSDGVFFTERTDPKSVTINFEGNNWPNDENRWRLDFGPPDGTALGRGQYKGAVRFPSNSAGVAGLSAI